MGPAAWVVAGGADALCDLGDCCGWMSNSILFLICSSRCSSINSCLSSLRTVASYVSTLRTHTVSNSRTSASSRSAVRSFCVNRTASVSLMGSLPMGSCHIPSESTRYSSSTSLPYPPHTVSRNNDGPSCNTGGSDRTDPHANTDEGTGTPMDEVCRIVEVGVLLACFAQCAVSHSF